MKLSGSWRLRILRVLLRAGFAVVGYLVMRQVRKRLT